MKEQYTPTQDEIEAAEYMMTSEQKEFSRIRETARKFVDPALLENPVKLEEGYNNLEKSLQELEGKVDLDSKIARDILIQGMNLLASLLGKDIKQGELKK